MGIGYGSIASLSERPVEPAAQSGRCSPMLELVIPGWLDLAQICP
jgi:hypothetical protein